MGRWLTDNARLEKSTKPNKHFLARAFGRVPLFLPKMEQKSAKNVTRGVSNAILRRFFPVVAICERT